jgi:1A family penicillin-binding protein
MRFLRDHLVQLREDWHTATSRHPRAVTAVVAGFVLCAILAIGSTAWVLSSLLRDLPDEDAINRMGEMDQATAVYDTTDALAFTIYKEQRIEVPFEQISPHVVRAILAIEDQRFYEHGGFDIVRIGAAALTNLRVFRAAQGASTITQQLARQSFLTPDKTIRRKLQELILAARVERRYTKSRILELYLNKVYFGDGLHGVEAASRGYFGKHASELSVAEAALLAGLVKSPSSYAPTVSMERATARRNIVLQAMLETRAIDRSTWQSARADRVALHDNLRADEPYGRYFKEQVRRELLERFGWERVYQGGLRVFSTIDMDMQKAAEAAVAEGLKAIDEKRKTIAARRRNTRRAVDEPGGPLQAALVAMDPETGHVRAMIGGRDFEESSFNRAVQARRQPGSAFKPFVYAAALEAGFTPSTMIDNLNAPIATLEGAWTPEDEHSEADEMSLRTALRTSSNRAAVRLLQKVGISRTVTYAKNMGVGDVPSVPSLALGSGEVTLQSLTAAYAAFANRGRVPTPVHIRRVEDRDGRVLYAAQESSRRAITERSAYLMATMLADVVNAGTGARARSVGFTLPAAGKTGTTNDFKDAWFIGFTPRLIAGVWVGFDQPQTIMPNGFAGDVAVPLWATFMKAATRGDKPQWITPPGGIVTANVCRLSGKLAAEGCSEVEVVNAQGHIERRSMIYTEYFVRGTQPTDICDLHPTRTVVSTLAAVFTGGQEKLPPPKIEETGLPSTTTPVVSAPPVAAAPPAAEEEKKKRGFWSRVFGIGRDREQ